MFAAHDFDVVRQAYAQRYPSLHCRATMFRSKRGAEYDQEVCRAEAGGGQIELRKRSGSEHDSSVSISSGAWLEWQRAVDRQTAQRGR
jgi:hypothetical protein